MRFAWNLWPTGPAAPARYVIEAGTAPGAANMGSATLTSRTFTVGIPPGTYHVRVRAINSCEESASTPDLVLTVP